MPYECRCGAALGGSTGAARRRRSLHGAARNRRAWMKPLVRAPQRALVPAILHVTYPGVRISSWETIMEDCRVGGERKTLHGVMAEPRGP